jgi:hypothetical protein
MAQPIAAEVWQNGIDDNRWLPGRHSIGIFTGNGVPIANNFDPVTGINRACRVWDIQVSDYITDYDDRRLNGLAGTNTDGRDGWGASAYGVFQDIRFDSRIYAIGRHRSIAWRIFDEMQYTGGIGNWGTATKSAEYTVGQGLMKTAQMISEAKRIWDAEVLGPDIDRYNFFAIANGHLSGRFVQDNPDKIFDGEGTWVAQPGMFQGESIPPRFAPILTIEWDDHAVPQLLENISITWDNLNIPTDNRVIIIDKRYRLKLMQALVGQGVPATEAAYSDLQNGTFTRLMGWDFNFDVPTAYFPKVYVDANGNVVHSSTGTAAYDAVINSIDGGGNPDLILQNKLAASNRTMQTNYIRTVWNNTAKRFDKVITNYPLGAPAADPYFGLSVSDTYAAGTTPDPYDDPDTFPYAGYPGHGIESPTGPIAPITRRQVIGFAVYRGSAQLSQEWSDMRTDEGNTRGKFTELVMDFKHDAWVNESKSAGILPIIDAIEDKGVFAIPVTNISLPETGAGEVTGLTVTPTYNATSGKTYSLAGTTREDFSVSITGTGTFDKDFSVVTSNPTIASIRKGNGTFQVTALAIGTSMITVTTDGEPTQSMTFKVIVTA